MSAIVKIGTVVLSQIIKHRRTIYRVLTAQDKYIARSMKAAGYGKQASYGVRSGALAGSVIGSFINYADDSPGNAIQKPFIKSPSGTPNKARYRQSIRGRSRSYSRKYSYKGRRCPRPRKRY